MVMLQMWTVKWRQNGHVTELVNLMEGARSCKVVSLMEGEWLCYRCGQFNGRRKVMLQRWPV